MKTLKGLIRLDRSNIDTAGKLLGNAFYNDPLIKYFLPVEVERRSAITDIYRFFVHFGVLYGEVYATSNNFEGVAIWLPSAKADMTMWRMFRSKGYSLVYKRVSPEVREKMFSFYSFARDIHHEKAPFLHWYLFMMGVKPDRMGKGYGKALITPMLERLDNENLPCFVETQNQNNIGFYSKFGFEIVFEGVIDKTDFKHTALIRNPGKKY